MNSLNVLKQKIKVSALLAIVSGLLATTTLADVVEISAEFVPDPANPGLNRFTNKTPSGGFCATWPTVCVQRKIFSIESNITADSNAPIQAHHSLRKGPMFQIPAQWSDVEVVHEDGIESETVQLRVTSIGSTYSLSHPANDLIGRPEVTFSKAHGLLWGGASKITQRGNGSGHLVLVAQKSICSILKGIVIFFTGGCRLGRYVEKQHPSTSPASPIQNWGSCMNWLHPIH